MSKGQVRFIFREAELCHSQDHEYRRGAGGNALILIRGGEDPSP